MMKMMKMQGCCSFDVIVLDVVVIDVIVLSVIVGRYRFLLGHGGPRCDIGWYLLVLLGGGVFSLAPCVLFLLFYSLSPVHVAHTCICLNCYWPTLYLVIGWSLLVVGIR